MHSDSGGQQAIHRDPTRTQTWREHQFVHSGHSPAQLRDLLHHLAYQIELPSDGERFHSHQQGQGVRRGVVRHGRGSARIRAQVGVFLVGKQGIRKRTIGLRKPDDKVTLAHHAVSRHRILQRPQDLDIPEFQRAQQARGGREVVLRARHHESPTATALNDSLANAVEVAEQVMPSEGRAI